MFFSLESGRSTNPKDPFIFSKIPQLWKKESSGHLPPGQDGFSRIYPLSDHFILVRSFCGFSGEEGEIVG